MPTTLYDVMTSVFALSVALQRRLQLDRAGSRALRGRLGLLEVQSRGLEKLRGEIALDPAFERRVLGRRVLADDVEHRVGVGILDGRPAVGGGVGLVDDQHAGGAAARRLLIFVGPAAVIGHRLAAEIRLRRPRSRGR